MSKRFRGFFGRVRANLLLEQALKFGNECHGVSLRQTISPDVRRMVREHLDKPRIPQTKEEAFFALVVVALPLLDAETLLRLFMDVEAYAEMQVISAEVRGYFQGALADLGPSQRVEIKNYQQWKASQNNQK